MVRQVLAPGRRLALHYGTLLYFVLSFQIDDDF